MPCVCGKDLLQESKTLYFSECTTRIDCDEDIGVDSVGCGKCRVWMSILNSLGES